MINVSLKKQVFYFVGIIIFSLVINLGTAFEDVMVRLKKPLFQQVFIATVALLYGYLYFIRKVYSKLFFKCTWYMGLHQRMKAIFFVLLSAGPVLLMHLFILNFMLAQRKRGTLFKSNYFETDFWFFIIPLLCYVVFLYIKPQVLLFRMPKMKVVPPAAVAENWIKEVQQGEREPEVELQAERARIIKSSGDQALPEMINESTDQDDLLLKLWQKSRVKKFVFEHYNAFQQKEKWDLSGDIPVWKSFILEKRGKVMIGYFLNGQNWVLHDVDDAILKNPWLIKINQYYYVNMLYIINDILDMDNGTKKKKDIEFLGVYDEIRNELEAVFGSEKLDFLLRISRRMKEKYFYKFWEEFNLAQLDESRLLDRLGRID